jgi:hypothetical protein
MSFEVTEIGHAMLRNAYGKVKDTTTACVRY